LIYKNLKRQFIILSLLFCLVAPALVTFLWLNHQKEQVRREVKWKIIEGIDRSELVLIQLSKAEAERKLEWEHSKEFEYEGEMYDVVEFESTADSVKYWCWWDYEETDLNKNLANLVDLLLGNHPHKKEQEQKLISFYQSLFSEEMFEWNASPYDSILEQFSCYQISLHNYTKNIPTPPPQLPS